jgi:hypothetical protein
MLVFNFNYYQGNITLKVSAEMPIKNLFIKYSQEMNFPQDTLKNLIFLANGQLIDIDSDQPVKTIGNQLSLCTTTILVNESEELSESMNLDLNTEIQLKQVNSNQFKLKNNSQKKIDVREVLEDMAIYGYYTNKTINKEDYKSFMPIFEACKKEKEDPQMFILGVLGSYLNYLGISSVIAIDQNFMSEQYQNLSTTALQFIFSGLVFKKKYYLSFALEPTKLGEMLKLKTRQDNFKNSLIETVSGLFGIPKDEILVTRPVNDRQYYTVILIFKEKDIMIEKSFLISYFANFQDLNKLIDVKRVSIIDAIILNKSMLDSRGNAKDGMYGHYEERGGEEYIPPDGFDRFGLNVYNKYDNLNNNWLSHQGIEGEWCVAYSWITYSKESSNLNEKYQNDEDTRNKGQKVGKGIYCSQTPDNMENYTQAIDINGQKFKLGLMLRVNPKKIRCPKSQEEFWVVNGNPDEIRPYGILIKKI